MFEMVVWLTNIFVAQGICTSASSTDRCIDAVNHQPIPTSSGQLGALGAHHVTAIWDEVETG